MLAMTSIISVHVMELKKKLSEMPFLKFQGLTLQPPAIEVQNDVGAGDSFFAGWLYCDGQEMSFEDSLVKATAVAVARCEVERPWQLSLERVTELEESLKSQVERIE